MATTKWVAHVIRQKNNDRIKISFYTTKIKRFGSKLPKILEIAITMNKHLIFGKKIKLF